MSEHWAEIRPSTQTWRVSYAGKMLLQSDAVLELDEHYGERAFATRYYFSPAAVAGLELTPSDVKSRCPLKGDAVFFTLAEAAGVEGAIWSYEKPFEAVAAIRGFVSFDEAHGFEIEAVPS